jgi:hypothetical protein
MAGIVVLPEAFVSCRLSLAACLLPIVAKAAGAHERRFARSSSAWHPGFRPPPTLQKQMPARAIPSGGHLPDFKTGVLDLPPVRTENRFALQ